MRKPNVRPIHFIFYLKKSYLFYDLMLNGAALNYVNYSNANKMILTVNIFISQIKFDFFIQ